MNAGVFAKLRGAFKRGFAPIGSVISWNGYSGTVGAGNTVHSIAHTYPTKSVNVIGHNYTDVKDVCTTTIETELNGMVNDKREVPVFGEVEWHFPYNQIIGGNNRSEEDDIFDGPGWFYTCFQHYRGGIQVFPRTCSAQWQRCRRPSEFAAFCEKHQYHDLAQVIRDRGHFFRELSPAWQSAVEAQLIANQF